MFTSYPSISEILFFFILLALSHKIALYGQRTQAVQTQIAINSGHLVPWQRTHAAQTNILIHFRVKLRRYYEAFINEVAIINKGVSTFFYHLNVSFDQLFTNLY